MKPTNLRIWMEVTALQLCADGMNAENALLIARDEYPVYREHDFSDLADQIALLIKEIDHD